MFTSYFWRFHLKNDPHLVSIARKTPEWFRGRRYPALAPRSNMLKLGEEEYRRKYKLIIDRLDPHQVYEDLGEESILLCWEPPCQFCHRRLVAAWLEEALGVTVPELPGNYNPNQKDLFTEGG
jgi:hypothetical protein